MDFKFIDEYNNEMHGYIDTLFGLSGETSEQRNTNADRLIESYFEVAGKIPPASALDRLGSYIMREDYEDKRNNKIQLTEYPTLSEDQLKRRDRKEFPNADLQYHSQDSVGSKKAIHNRDDGTNYEVNIPVMTATVPNTTQKPLY